MQALVGVGVVGVVESGKFVFLIFSFYENAKNGRLKM